MKAIAISVAAIMLLGCSDRQCEEYETRKMPTYMYQMVGKVPVPIYAGDIDSYYCVKYKE